jgi:restriction endonuclease S subunit
VSFIGLDESLLAEATLAELQSKNYSLNFKQHLTQIVLEVDGFEMMKLGDILDNKSSGKTKVAEMTNSGEYPFFSCKIHNPCGTHASFDHAEPEYLLFAKSGGNAKQPIGDALGIGRFYHMTSKSASTTDVSKFTLKADKAIKLKYVHIVLQTKLHEIQSMARYTTGLGHIDITQMLNVIQIPVPSLERQQQILEAIDGWTRLAQHEEQALKILETQIMFQVKEMGRGQPHVKLGEVCEINHGMRITKKDNIGTIYPVYGGGNDTFRTDAKNREGFTCKVSRFGISEHNCVQTIHGDYWLMDSGFTVMGVSEKTIDSYIYYWLMQHKIRVYQCGRATAQMNMDMDAFQKIEIPLPPLAEQQTLQSDFDEIRHKHEKIKMYKAKAQSAVQRLIPSADANT